MVKYSAQSKTRSERSLKNQKGGRENGRDMEFNESMSLGLCDLLCFWVSGLQYNTTEHLVCSEAKEKGEELTLAEKLTVLKILADRNFEIDFSGGDPLYYDEDFRVVEQSTR